MSKNFSTLSALGFFSCLTVLSFPALGDASNPNPVIHWLSEGQVFGEARYRYEFVDQSNFNENARASTLRTHLGYKTAPIYNFSGLVEVENIVALGPEDYDSTTNGNTQFPRVLDPENTEINQLHLDYSGVPHTLARIGRQAINRGNLRFVGDVNWRQNQQTHDALTIQNWGLSDVQVFYGYSQNVNRVLGEDNPLGNFKGDFHLADVRYATETLGDFTAYGYVFDFDNASNLSSSTFGASLEGEKWINDTLSARYRAEYANQSDNAANATDYNAHYFHLNGGIQGDNWALNIGSERLGDDNGVGFSTPLAMLHKFNGWADVFLTTPQDGLQDTYIQTAYQVTDTHPWIDNTIIRLHYHDFQSFDGDETYGHEIDADIGRVWDDKYEVALRYAYYDADGFSNDTQKAILTLRYFFGE